MIFFVHHHAVSHNDISHGDRRCGFTLVELLAVITIVSILGALTLIGVQSARESARRVQCENNLRQLSLAVANHESAHRHLPTNGWGYMWIGEPRRGFGKSQPGGWAFNVLPFMEKTSVWRMTMAGNDTDRMRRSPEMLKTQIPDFVCPSWPIAPVVKRAHGPWTNAILPLNIFNTCYVGNGGSRIFESVKGPRSSAEAEDYVWPEASQFDGLFFPRSTVALAEVSDGLSNTYLIGEKHLSSVGEQELERGATFLGSLFDGGGCNQSMHIGDSQDIRRTGEYRPMRNGITAEHGLGFGSYHGQSMNMAFCDGSVRSISYQIALETHRTLASRRDGQPANSHQP